MLDGQVAPRTVRKRKDTEHPAKPNSADQLGGQQVVSRSERLGIARNCLFDVTIVGGGVNGACLYDRLCRQGYRVALLDRGDFGSGTSQASAMMVWGGLLYLRSLDFRSVYNFSEARDRMISVMSNLVTPRLLRYCFSPGNLFGRYLILAGLYAYWTIGRFKRRRPALEECYPESKLLKKSVDSLVYEEAFLNTSDSRFVLQWITPHQPPDGVALNCCKIEGGAYRPAEQLWRIQVVDRLEKKEIELRSHLVVNCAGVWADTINAAFAIRSPYKHVFSKGVFINFPRQPEHLAPLIFEMGEHGDVLTSLPWGPVAMWGPTETAITELDEGFVATADDVRFLLDHRKRCLKEQSRKEDIVALRCGVRPLAVKSSFDSRVYPLELSRSFRIAVDPARPWISSYGGKLTGCSELASRVANKVRDFFPAPATGPAEHPQDSSESIPVIDFPGLSDPQPDPGWCRTREFCCTLDDYLRRRTNISQWVPRGGLGREDEHLPFLRTICLTLRDGDIAAADRELKAYRAKVTEQFDTVLQSV